MPVAVAADSRRGDWRHRSRAQPQDPRDGQASRATDQLAARGGRPSRAWRPRNASRRRRRRRAERGVRPRHAPARARARADRGRARARRTRAAARAAASGRRSRDRPAAAARGRRGGELDRHAVLFRAPARRLGRRRAPIARRRVGACSSPPFASAFTAQSQSPASSMRLHMVRAPADGFRQAPPASSRCG